MTSNSLVEYLLKTDGKWLVAVSIDNHATGWQDFLNEVNQLAARHRAKPAGSSSGNGELTVHYACHSEAESVALLDAVHNLGSEEWSDVYIEASADTEE